MDNDKNKKIFTELNINIQQQAEKSLSILVVRTYEIVEYITIWLELEIPSYSQSEDFRIVVQNEILDEVAKMKVNIIAYMSEIVDYREQRAIANKELFKRPKFDDNYHSISNLDEQLYRNLKLMPIEMKSYILHICKTRNISAFL